MPNQLSPCWATYPSLCATMGRHRGSAGEPALLDQLPSFAFCYAVFVRTRIGFCRLEDGSFTQRNISSSSHTTQAAPVVRPRQEFIQYNHVRRSPSLT